MNDTRDTPDNTISPTYGLITGRQSPSSVMFTIEYAKAF